MVNMDRNRLPGTRLEALVARINHRDSFHAGKVGESGRRLPSAVPPILLSSRPGIRGMSLLQTREARDTICTLLFHERLSMSHLARRSMLQKEGLDQLIS